MNITPLTIYLWQMADQIKGSLMFIAIPSLIVCVIAFVCRLNCDEGSAEPDVKERAACWRVLRWFLPTLAVSALLLNIIPNSKTVAMMVIVPKLAESRIIQTDIPELYDVAVQALKEAIKPQK